MKKLEKKLPAHVHQNVPLYAGGLLLMVVVKLSFLAGGLFVVAIQQAKLIALAKKDKKLVEQITANTRKVTKPAKKAVKKTAKKVVDKVDKV